MGNARFLGALAFPFLLPQWPMGRAATEGLSATDLRSVQALLDDTVDALGRARPARNDATVVIDEILATAALLRLSCRDALLRLSGDGSLAWARLARAGVLRR